MAGLDSGISWPAVHYIIAEVQYGGMITDSRDTKLFQALTERWLTAAAMEPGVSLFPTSPLVKGVREFEYTVCVVVWRFACRVNFAAA